MRLTKIFCAIVSSLAVAVSAQVVTQIPAPAPAAPANNDDALREAARQALESATPRPGPLTTYDYSVTGSITNSRGPVVGLTLREAVALALQHNLDLKVFRYNPVISEYDRRALFGVYDPTFNAGFTHSERSNPPGGNFNPHITRPAIRQQCSFGEQSCHFDLA